MCTRKFLTHIWCSSLFIFVKGQSLKEAKMAMLLVEPVLLVTDETCVSWCIHVQNGDIPSLKWRVLMESTSTELANDDNQCMICSMNLKTQQELGDAIVTSFVFFVTGQF